MAEYSFPWTSVTGDRQITSGMAQALNASLMENGALEAFDGSTSSTTVTVTAGAAMIEGVYYNVGTPSVGVSLAGIAGDAATIVVRYDASARTVALVAIETSPVRSGGTWDLPVAALIKSGNVWSQPDWAYEWALYAGADPVGAYRTVATATAPIGYLAADGSAVSRTTYARLFAAVGTTYGAGNGTTTFNLPDVRGRTFVGKKANDTDFDTIGETGGAKTHQLVSSEMPSHTHTQNAHTHTQDAHNHTEAATVANVATTGSTTVYGAGTAVNTGNATATNQNATAVNQNTGGDGAHNNLQPYIVGLVCIKA